MKSKIVRYRADEIPPLSAEALERLKKLADMPDSEIDLTDPDAPELSDEHWANAVRGRFYRPIKEQVTAKVDSDVIAWLKKDGRGYQTRMNAILREAMLKALQEKKKAA